MADGHPSSPPRKRVRLDETLTFAPRMNTKEEDVGIVAFVNPDIPGFSGVFKKRYTDFLVNEVLPSGEVVHLLSTKVPRSTKKATEVSIEVQDKIELQEDTVNDVDPEQSQSKPDTVQEDGLAAWQKAADESGNLRLTPEHEDQLSSLVGSDATKQVLALFNKILAKPGRKPKDYGSVTCPAIDDKDKRTRLHQVVRTIFHSRLETSTSNDGSIVAQAAPQPRLGRGATGGDRGGRGRGGQGGRNQREQRLSWEELGGDYLHFTLYKENKDTMEVISYLARELHVKPQSFQFAGTKDRRGVTAQKVSAYRILADRLAQIGKKARGWKVGDFEYRQHALALGDLTGNEFVITLRDCQGRERVAAAVEGIRRGFINYFGMQRFGTFATRTHTIGIFLLQGDFKGAVSAILHYPAAVLEAAKKSDEDGTDKISKDDKFRALAIHYFEQGDSKKALATIPRRFSAENQLIRHLNSQKSEDYLGAIQTIQRNLRMMYLHAYQSVIWNLAASQRWTAYGDKVQEGDLVMVNEHRTENLDGSTSAEAAEEIDADGEVVVQPMVQDRAVTEDDRFERARALTAEEAESGRYSIFDVVLPTPGYDILYPAQMVKFYEVTMAKDEYGNLDPHDMRRKWRDMSLSGSYRKILSRVDKMEYEVKEYQAENEQFAETDSDKLSKSETRTRNGSEADPGQEQEAPEQHKMAEDGQEAVKTAVVLKFQLGTSQYATMALRELTKQGLETYTMEFSGGR